MRSKRPQTAEGAEQQIAEIIDGLPPDEKPNIVLSMYRTLREVDPLTYWAQVFDAYVMLPKKARQGIGKALAAKTGYATVTPGELERLKRIIVLAIEGMGEQARSQANYRKCSQVRRKAPLARKEAIDFLYKEQYQTKEIYKTMKLMYQDLMKGREKTFMDEDEMWRSYKKHGGTKL